VQPSNVINGQCHICNQRHVPVADLLGTRQVIAICEACLRLALRAITAADDTPQDNERRDLQGDRSHD
jgi:hypothetical protein